MSSRWSRTGMELYGDQQQVEWAQGTGLEGGFSFSSSGFFSSSSIYVLSALWVFFRVLFVRGHLLIMSSCSCRRIDADVKFVGQRSVPGETEFTRLCVLYANRVMWVRRQVPVQPPSWSQQLGESLTMKTYFMQSYTNDFGIFLNLGLRNVLIPLPQYILH